MIMMQKDKGFTILWDFDGTLFDSYPIYTKKFQQVLNDGNVTEQEVYKQLKISFRHASSFFHFSEEQLEGFFRLEERILPKDIKPFDSVENVLNFASKNVIMTHKRRNDVSKILDYYGWEKYFSEIVAGDDGFPRKPNIESYEYLHQKHKIDLAIGDREIDIIPANKLGISTCLFQNSNSNIADFYLEDYKDFWNKIAHSIV